jgi:hypothetical protein
VIVTTFPDRCLRITGRTARVTFIGPTRFPLERCLHCRLRRRQARDVELDDQQVVSLADGVGHGFGVAAGRDDCVAGGERGLAMSTPMPRPAPVMSQTLLSAIFFSPFLLAVVELV